MFNVAQAVCRGGMRVRISIALPIAAPAAVVGGFSRFSQNADATYVPALRGDAAALPDPYTDRDDPCGAEQFCARNGTSALDNRCDYLWPDTDINSTNTLDPDYVVALGMQAIYVHRGGEYTTLLLYTLFGTLSANLDLVQWVACCMEGKRRAMSHFLQARLTGTGSPGYGEKKRIQIHVITAPSDLPDVDHPFVHEDIWIRLKTQAGIDFYTSMDLVMMTVSTDHLLLFPNTKMWKYTRDRFVAAQWSMEECFFIISSGQMLHELVHQYGMYLYRDEATVGAEFKHDGYTCNFPFRVQNSYEWAMFKRYTLPMFESSPVLDTDCCVHYWRDWDWSLYRTKRNKGDLYNLARGAAWEDVFKCS